MKEIVANVTAAGKVTIKVKGIPGESCLEDTRALEEALGLEVDDRELTPEYYEAAEGQKELA